MTIDDLEIDAESLADYARTATPSMPAAAVAQETPEPISIAEDLADFARMSSIKMTFGDLGFIHLSENRAMRAVQESQQKRGVRAPGQEDIPFANYAYTYEGQKKLIAAQARMLSGKQTPEDEEALLQHIVETAQDPTFAGGVMDIIYSLGTSIGELSTGAGTAVVAGKVASKAAAKMAMREGMKRLVSRGLEAASKAAVTRSLTGAALKFGPTAAQIAKTGAKLGTTVGLQEALPRVFGEVAGIDDAGGAWSVQTIKNLVGADLTDEQAQEINNVKGALGPILLEMGGGLLADGLLRQSIQIGVEGAGGVLAKLPVVKQVDMATAAVMRKLFPRASAVGWPKALAEFAEMQGVGGEVAEEFVAGIAEALATGESVMDSVAANANMAPEMLAAMFLVRGGALGVGEAKLRLQGAPKPGAASTIEPVPTSPGPMEGGDPTQATPEAPSAEGVAASAQSPAVTPDAREGLAGLQRALRDRLGAEVDVQAVEPEGVQEQAASAFARRRGVEVQFYERGALPEGTDEATLEDAYFPGAGNRIFLRRGSRDVGAVAVHEQVHVWEAQQPEARRTELTAALSDLVPAEVRAVSQALARTPLYRGRPQAEIESEVRAGVAQTMAGLVQMLDTAQGRQAFTDLTARPEGALRRIATAVYDWIADRIRALPQSKRARARAFLRLARGEENRALAAQRLLDALNEIRPAEQRVDAGAAPTAAVAEEAAPEVMQEVIAPVEAAARRAEKPKDTPEQRRANRAARKARAAERVQRSAEQAQAEAAAREAKRASIRLERERMKQAIEKGTRRKTTRVVEDTDAAIDWDAETAADIEQFGLGRDTERFAASLYNSVPAFAQNTTRRYLDRFRTLFQDNTIPLRELPEVRTNVKRYRAQMPDRLRRFENRLVAMLKPFKVGEFDDMERAVYLQAAMQRNAWLLQSRGVQDGAGISTADAQIELAQIEQRLGKPRLDALFAEHRSLNAERLAHLEEAGFITAQQVADWGTREPNWISMRDIDPAADEHIAFGVGGRSMSVRNPQVREAKGRKTELEHPLLAWASEYATRIVAAEKNKALRDAAANGIPSVPKPQNVPGGFTAPDTYVPYVEQGQQMFLETQSKEQADVLKALDGETLGLVTSIFGKVTRAWSRAVTGQNPAFWPLNFLRDSFQAASYTLTERSAAYSAKALARSYAALPLLLRYQLNGNAAGLPMLDAAQRAGFKTTWVGRRTLSEQLAWMRDQVEGNRGARAKLRAVLRTLESVGDSFEMATRYAVFEGEVQRQLKAGATQAEAEQLAGDYAREITLNFDTKGSLTPHLAAFFAFFNPAMQGGARLMQVAMSVRGAGFVTSLALAGFLMEALNYAVSEDDERTGLNLYGSLPEYEKSRNIILPIWKGKSPLKITMPYGLDAIYGLGRRLYLLSAGKELDPRIETNQVVWEGLLHASTAFNPLGDISDPYTMVTPTVLRPFVEIDRNRKFGDRPIMRPGESFGQTVPDSARAFESIDDRVSGWLAVRIADALNLGGPEELPTGLDVSPESVQHLIEFVGAGFGGRDIDRLSEHFLSDKPVSLATTIPVLRGFSTSVTDHYISAEYYDIAEKASRIRAMEKNPANEGRLDWVRNLDARAWELRKKIGRADRRMGEIRQKIRAKDTSAEDVAKLREQITEVQAGVVREYYARNQD